MKFIPVAIILFMYACVPEEPKELQPDSGIIGGACPCQVGTGTFEADGLCHCPIIGE